MHQIRFGNLLAIRSAVVRLGTKLKIHSVRQAYPCAAHRPVLHEKVYLSKITLQAVTPWDGVILSAWWG